MKCVGTAETDEGGTCKLSVNLIDFYWDNQTNKP